MPTLEDLGRALGQRLVSSTSSVILSDQSQELLHEGRIPTGNVEMWLSSLAERQPFESRAAAFRNQSLFEEISQILVQLVAEAQNGFWPAAPPWLHRLLRLWHLLQPTVVTFNYDTLIEQSMQQLDAPGADGDIIAAMLTQVPRRAVQSSFGEVPARTFRLLKLHGSLDWYWNPDDRSGDSLCRRTQEASAHDLRAALAGKVSFIVPPLATKAPFYSLGLVRQLWGDAAHALAGASRITAIGYSVPLTDLATSAMLSESTNKGAHWQVVNPDGAGVRDRLITIGVAAENIRVYASLAKWIDDYETEYCTQINQKLLEQLDSFRSTYSRTAPIMTRRSRSDYGTIVRAMRHEGNRLVLEAHERSPQTIIPADYPHEPDLVDALRTADPLEPVLVRFDQVEGEFMVLGALDPMPLRGTGAVPVWCPLEVQDVPSIPAA